MNIYPATPFGLPDTAPELARGVRSRVHRPTIAAKRDVGQFSAAGRTD